MALKTKKYNDIWTQLNICIYINARQVYSSPAVLIKYLSIQLG